MSTTMTWRRGPLSASTAGDKMDGPIPAQRSKITIRVSKTMRQNSQSSEFILWLRDPQGMSSPQHPLFLLHRLEKVSTCTHSSQVLSLVAHIEWTFLYLSIQPISKHLKGQLVPRVGNVTFFNHGGQLGPHVSDVTFFNHGGQLGPRVSDVTFFAPKEVG